MFGKKAEELETRLKVPLEHVWKILGEGASLRDSGRMLKPKINKFHY